jgi:hypothetical protein
VAALLAGAQGLCAEPPEYPPHQAGRAGQARLEYVHGIPVLHLRGEPGDLGREQGQLLAPQIRALRAGYLERFLDPQERAAMGLAALGLAPHMPPEHVAEIHALADAAGERYVDALLANTFLDLMRVAFCSVVITRERPDGPWLFARNNDFPTLGIAHRASLLLVVHQVRPGRRSFVAVGWPGLIGVISGINDAGLCVATLVSQSASGVEPGMPYPLLYRQVLERCATPQEALALIQATRRASANNLAVAGPAGEPLVIEFSPRAVAARRPEGGILLATNHFRAPELARAGEPACPRYARLRQLAGEHRGPWDIPTLQAMLRAVQVAGAPDEPSTLQAMVFEPAARRLHLAIGHLPAPEGRFVTIDCARLLERGQEE